MSRPPHPFKALEASTSLATLDACVAQHPGDRAEQQDAAGLFRHPKHSGLVLAVVADGMGGHTGGMLAAEQVLLTARHQFEAFAPANETPEQLLTSLIEEAHLMIRTNRALNEKEPHSTVVALLLRSEARTWRAHWAHCGDSRLYHLRGSRVVAQTADHSLVETLLRQGRITAAEADVHPQRNVLLTALGGAQAPQIDYGHAADLGAGDSFVLCSDGLWSYFGPVELAALVALQPPRQAAETLLAKARQRARGSGDNLSMTILKLLAPRRAAPARRGAAG